MAKILVFQHVAAEPLGTLDALIRARGHRIRFYNFSRDPHAQPELSRYDGLVVLGGPMNLDDSDRYPHIKTELRAIAAALAQDKPVLGICLGGQMLAQVLGACVYANPTPEIGWYEVAPTSACAEDGVLAPLRGPQPIFQWHSRTFDLPSGATHLARSEGCANQAFRYGNDAYAFQFHLEMNRALIERWLAIPAYLEELAAANGVASATQIRADTIQYMPALTALAARVFNNFLDRVGKPRPRQALPSR